MPSFAQTVTKTLSVLIGLLATLANGGIFPDPMPGACHNGNVGVGCSFDYSQLAVRGVTINPKRQAAAVSECSYFCLLKINWYKQECYSCFWAVGALNKTYWVPQGLEIQYTPQFDSLFSVNMTSTLDGWGLMSQHEWKSSGVISSSSKEWKHWVYHYFLEQSMASVTAIKLHYLEVGYAAGYQPFPTPELVQAVALLPATYDNDTYLQFVRDWGTHYVTSTSLGGLINVNIFVDRCITSLYDKTTLTEHSRDFVIHVSGGASGTISNNTLMYNYSSVDVVVLGGTPPQLGVISQHNVISPAQRQAWQASVAENPVPIDVTLEPLSTLIAVVDKAKAANFDTALQNYNVTVNSANSDFVSQLSTQANTTMPKWCKEPPPPLRTGAGTPVPTPHPGKAVPQTPAALEDPPSVEPMWPTLVGLETSVGTMGERLGRFFDPTNQVSTNGVVGFTYGNTNANNNTFVDAAGARSAVPDQVTVFKVPALDDTLEVHTFVNMSSYLHYESSYSGWTAGIVSWGDAHATVNGLLSNGANTVYHTRIRSVSTKAVLTPSAVLANQLKPGGVHGKELFALAVDALTLETKLGTATPATYTRFLQTWGPYYTSSAFLGGQLDIYLAVNKTIIAKGEIDVAASVFAAFSFIGIDLGYIAVSAGAKLDMHLDVIGSSTLVVVGVGGNPLKLILPLSAADVQSWLPSVPKNPAPITDATSFTPTYMLVSDPATQAALAKATAAYMNTSAHYIPTACTAPLGTAMPLSQFPFTGNTTAARAASPEAQAAPPVGAPIQLPLGAVGQAYSLPQGTVGTAVTSPIYTNRSVVSLPWTVPGTAGVAALGSTAVSIPRAFSVSTTPPVCTVGNFSVYFDLDLYVRGRLDLSLGWAGLGWDLPAGWLAHADAGVAALFDSGLRVLGVLETKVPLIELSYGGNPAAQDLSPSLASALAALPPTPDASAYGSFFESVGGTHWVGSQEWGVYANVTISLNASVVAAIGEEASSTFVGAALIEIIGILKGAISTLKALVDVVKALLTPTICGQLAASATVTVCGCGGDVASLITDQNMQSWLSSANSAPAPIPWSQKLRPMDELVTNATRRDAMRDAIASYLNQTAPPASPPGAQGLNEAGGALVGCGCYSPKFPLNATSKACVATSMDELRAVLLRHANV